MDAIDKKLIALLQANARESISSLSRMLGIARSTVTDRLARIEKNGIITGYTLRLNPRYERTRIVAHVMLTVDPKLNTTIVTQLKKYPALRSLYAVSGQYDLIGIVEADSPEDIDQLLDEIGAMPGVLDTNSSIILSVKVDR